MSCSQFGQERENQPGRPARRRRRQRGQGSLRAEPNTGLRVPGRARFLPADWHRDDIGWRVSLS